MYQHVLPLTRIQMNQRTYREILRNMLVIKHGVLEYPSVVHDFPQKPMIFLVSSRCRVAEHAPLPLECLRTFATLKGSKWVTWPILVNRHGQWIG